MRRTTALLGLLALSLSACGGAAPPAPAPPADGQPSSLKAGEESYASLDQTEQGLRRAQAELHSALGAAPAGDASGAATRAGRAAPPGPAPAGPPAPPPDKAGER